MAEHIRGRYFHWLSALNKAFGRVKSQVAVRTIALARDAGQSRRGICGCVGLFAGYQVAFESRETTNLNDRFASIAGSCGKEHSSISRADG